MPIFIENDYELLDINIERQSAPIKQKTISESFKELIANYPHYSGVARMNILLLYLLSVASCAFKFEQND